MNARKSLCFGYPGETQKSRYTFRSRTTQWRRKKRRQAASCTIDDESTSDSDAGRQQIQRNVNQLTFQSANEDNERRHSSNSSSLSTATEPATEVEEVIPIIISHL